MTQRSGQDVAVVTEGGGALMPIAAGPVLPRDRNPIVTYLGRLDRASVPTMASTARRVVEILAPPGTNPERFPWHVLRYPIVRRLLVLLREGGASPRTVNKALTLVRNVCEEAWNLQLMSSEDYARIRGIKGLKFARLPAGRVVEQEEVAQLLRVCCVDGSDARLRDAGFVALLRGAGLREKEATKVACGDYDSTAGTIRVRFGKHHREREAYVEDAFQPLLGRLVEALSSRVVDVASSAPLLPRLSPSGAFMAPLRSVTTQAVHKLLAARGAEAGLEPFTPHDLRRSFITFQLAAGVDPLRLARAVGHESPKTTMLYDRRTRDDDRAAIQAAGFAFDTALEGRVR